MKLNGNFVCVLVKIFLVKLTVVIADPYRNDSTQDQLMSFATQEKIPKMLTTSTGFPVTVEDTQTINTRLIFNDFFMESLSHLVHERIPERIVHAKGYGAFGYFQVTHDLSDICKVKMFESVGKTTPLLARFSPTNPRSGGSDLARDNRGLAVKFYTEEGNFDLVMLTIDMFSIKDPIHFPSFARIFQKNPKTQVLDSNKIWDFFTLRPETLHFTMRLFGDRGIPNGYRHMPGFPIHTFELLNHNDDRTYVRFHLLPDAGIQNLTTAQAQEIQGEDLDYFTRDLYNAINEGNFPTWTLYRQTIPFERVTKVNFDIFDVTWIWPLDTFPLKPVGKLVLNEVPENHFATIEQVAFNPGNLVPGIRGVDSLFEARVLNYRSAHNYRLGANFNRIHVNCPLQSVVNTYNRDGRPPVLDNEGEKPNYYPNSFHGPVPYKKKEPARINVYTDPTPNNFDQARETYIAMTEGERCRLVENIVTLLQAAEKFIQERTVKLYKLIHIELGERLEHRLWMKNDDPNKHHSCDIMFLNHK